MVCCCISCKAGPCSQSPALPGASRCQGPAELGEAAQTSLAVTSLRSCHLPWSFSRHRQTCWGGQWWLSSPGPVPTPGAHEVPAATYSHSFCPCRGGTVAWPPARAPESWAQLPILQAGDTAQGASQSTKPGPRLGTPHASPSPWGSSLRGSQLTQPGTRASGQAPLAQRAPAVGREQGRAVLLAPSSTVCPQALLHCQAQAALPGHFSWDSARY